MERVEEEWGKVERVDEELSGTYLKEKSDVVCEKVFTYVRKRSVVRQRTYHVTRNT